MRVAIQTLGTRGDVQPYIALARGLMAHGHEVQLAAPAQFAAMAAQHDTPFVGLPGEFLALLNTPEGKAAIAGGKGFSTGLKILGKVRPLMLRLLDAEWQAVRSFEPDLIVYHPKSIAAPDMATVLDIPHVLASPLPGFNPTAAFPTPLLPFASLGPLNRESHRLAMHGGEILFRRELKAWRKSVLSFKPGERRQQRSGTLYAYSPAVLPKPHDWGPDVLVSGYWFLDEPHWRPDPALASFLEAGPPPVYFGFGSMPGLNPERMAELITNALDLTGKRGLVAGGNGAIAPQRMGERAFFLSSAPHDRLLPKTSATVHHGGAGTTGASLRAGIPTQIIPFFGDQPFWGRRVAELGAGPPPLDRKSLNADMLAIALTAMDEAAMKSRAKAIGAAIACDRGVDAAVTFLEEVSIRPRRLS